jgi:hypothetical protein
MKNAVFVISAAEPQAKHCTENNLRIKGKKKKGKAIPVPGHGGP